MDISKACLPPIQPSVSQVEKNHPRFSEYQSYRASMSCLLVTADSFSSWLRQTERTEWEAKNWEEWVYYVKPGALMAQGWYKNVFAPGHKLIKTIGPFSTKVEAEESKR